MTKCQCENKEHFGNSPGVHDFEEVKATKQVDTRYGKFNSCDKCAKTHLKTFQVEEETENFFRREAKF